MQLSNRALYCVSALFFALAGLLMVVRYYR
jgi:hypothetical protein